MFVVGVMGGEAAIFVEAVSRCPEAAVPEMTKVVTVRGACVRAMDGDDYADGVIILAAKDDDVRSLLAVNEVPALLVAKGSVDTADLNAVVAQDNFVFAWRAVTSYDAALDCINTLITFLTDNLDHPQVDKIPSRRTRLRITSATASNGCTCGIAVSTGPIDDDDDDDSILSCSLM